MGPGRARKRRREINVYVGSEIANDLRTEAARLDRSLPWLMRQAWTIAREQIRRLECQAECDVLGAETRCHARDSFFSKLQPPQSACRNGSEYLPTGEAR
jgi:uncharacterized small protein (TIGR04563 family)